MGLGFLDEGSLDQTFVYRVLNVAHKAIWIPFQLPESVFGNLPLNRDVLALKMVDHIIKIYVFFILSQFI